jgi:SAM-dependent methyltransferase
MRKPNIAICFILAVLVLYIASPAVAHAQQYEPTVGQEGKDVIWVPTPEELVQAMLNVAKVTANDYVMDLGSGDGRIVIAAAKRGAKAVGFEFNPDMVALSKRNAEKAEVSDKASFVNADIFESDFSKATVITMYLLPQLNLKLRPKILDLKPGTRVVSHAFRMDDWVADQTVDIEGRTAYLWIVPAKVGGTWTLKTEPGSADLQILQIFQKFEGTLKTGGKELPLKNGKLDGAGISFTVGDEPAMQEYSGQVNGNSIEGIVKMNGREQKWSAAHR